MHGEAWRLPTPGGSLEISRMAADSQPFERGARGPSARLSGPGAFRRFMLAGMASIAYPGTRAEQLLLAPQELRTADPSFATELYNGHFGLAGRLAEVEIEFAVRDHAAVGWLGARALRIWLAQASPRGRQRAVARAGKSAGAGFHRAQALASWPCLAAGDRRPQGHLLAFQFGAHSRQSASRKPTRTSSGRSPRSFAISRRAIATRRTACRVSSR